jgi:4-hydroxy-tetrahydrodipicolinate reductase
VRAFDRNHVGTDVGEAAGIGAIGTRIEALGGDAPGVAADVVIDFSSSVGTFVACKFAVRNALPIVSGTTALDRDAQVALDEASAHVPAMWEPNMSVGVHVLGLLVEAGLRALGDGYDVEIVETHHRRKVDAPSGTARRLFEIVKSVRPDAGAVSGREGKPGARTESEVGLLAVRGGDIIGDHTVHFLGDGERLELTHRATDRALFARGALRAGAWLRGRPAARYTMRDVISASVLSSSP